MGSLISCSPMTTHAAHAQTTSPTLVIGEVAWAGSSVSTADEWLELWNVTDTPISLAGWLLRGATDTPTLALPTNAIIAPHDLFLISNYAMNDAKSILATTTHLVTTSVSLSNSKLQIDLIDPSGTVVDSVGTGGIPPAGTSLPIKATMIRSGDVWMTATTTFGMKPGVTDLGTPGVCDACDLAPQQPPQTTENETTSTPDIQTETTTTTAEIVTTSTDIGIAPIETGTTTSTTNTVTSTQETAPTQTTAQTITAVVTPTTPSTPQPPKPVYEMLRLNEVMPYPSSGKEWIEITTMDAGNSINLKGCTLHDAQGKIVTIGSKIIDPLTSRYLAITLSSSRLNNDGDSISLYAPDGQLIDTMIYPKTIKDESWIRDPDQTGGWKGSLIATPNAANINAPIPATTPTNATTSTPDVTATSTLIMATSDPINETALFSNMEEPLPDESKLIEPPEITESVAAELTTPTVKTKTSTGKKSPTKSAPRDIIHPITFDMFPDTTSDIHVRLSGRVGSPIGLTSGHTFVLQNDDGRGILVTAPTKLRLPSIEKEIALSGTLHLDDRGVASIKMSAKDTWFPLPTSTIAIAPRVVDLLLPATEDAWSLIHATGTVTGVSGSTIHLDLEGVDLDVLIKPLLKYRAKRIVVGDTITVTGLLDLSKDDPRILPRRADDIVIISHATPPATKASTSTIQAQGPVLPGWAPIGAAIGAIAATEGTKRLHQKIKIKRLEKKLAAL